jgi:heme-degrading monooxygenase HmoA
VTIARLIYVTVALQDAADAERIWKEDCAPLMIKQQGCVSEELLKSIDAPGEYISYSEWQDQGAIDRYDGSEAHREIERHTQRLKVTQPPVTKHYQIAG